MGYISTEEIVKETSKVKRRKMILEKLDFHAGEMILNRAHTLKSNDKDIQHLVKAGLCKLVRKGYGSCRSRATFLVNNMLTVT